MFRQGLRLLPSLALAVAQPTLRIALALPFLRSGMTRWDGFLNLASTTQFLFEEQFKLHILGGEYAIPFPDQVVFLTSSAEIGLPVLLLTGFATRLSALGLLAMTGVIQLIMPDGWQNFHLNWAAIALAIIVVGPGPLALDRLFGRGATS
jgi:putative oxidoreductase